jgi:hypothetical protein
MFEPVTMMRSVSATPPVAFCGGWFVPLTGAAPVASGAFSGWAALCAAGEGCCANNEPARNGIAAPTARAVRSNPNFLTVVVIISFSIGVWLGLAVRIQEEFHRDKRFFHFF